MENRDEQSGQVRCVPEHWQLAKKRCHDLEDAVHFLLLILRERG